MECKYFLLTRFLLIHFRKTRAGHFRLKVLLSPGHGPNFLSRIGSWMEWNNGTGDMASGKTYLLLGLLFSGPIALISSTWSCGLMQKDAETPYFYERKELKKQRLIGSPHDEHLQSGDSERDENASSTPPQLHFARSIPNNSSTKTYDNNNNLIPKSTLSASNLNERTRLLSIFILGMSSTSGS